MRNAFRYGTRGLVVLLLFVTSASPTPSRVEAAPGAATALAQDPPAEKCCFTNPSYAGTCAVAPAKDETCGQILEYLNNPSSQGKSYCNGTTIRGGWGRASCEGKE
jgi:hypothetical protein